MKPRIARLLVLGLIVSTLGLGTANAAYEPKNEFGVLFGVGFPDKEFVGADDDYKPNPLIGLRYAHLFDNERLVWFADGTWGAYKGSTPLGNVAATTGRLGLEYWFSPEKDGRWFLSGGAGWMGFAPATGDDFGRGLVSLGFGHRSQVSEKLAHRWELRADQTVTGSSGLGGKDVLNAQFLLGLTFGRPRTPKDDDGDGVRNKLDQCPGTMSGCVVDAVGCPRDTDQDGVCDGLDRCPGTPAGCPVDAGGCPLDADGDGVCDGMDKCPGTAKGCKVDAAG
jgi:OOP family OmpA-OmpF porin